MLVNCPKCGFSQPKDQYCANCGVDMERFRPTGAPIGKKILASPFLYVVLVFGLVFSSVYYIRQKQREELQARVEFLRGGPVMVERAKPSESTPTENSATETQVAHSAPSENVDSGSAAPPPPAVETPAPPTTQAAAEPPPTPAANLASRKAEPASVKSHSTRAVVIYAEVDSIVLNTWMDEARTQGLARSFDDVTMAPVQQISQKIKAGRGIKVLQQLDHNIHTANMAIDWFVGTHRTPDTENEMGFFSSLVVGDTKDGLIRGEIEVQRAFRDPKDPSRHLERISYGGPFEMAPSSGYVMRGLLPRKYATDLDEESNPDPVLSILKSPSFRAGQTEFTLIIEFDTSGNQR